MRYPRYPRERCTIHWADGRQTVAYRWIRAALGGKRYVRVAGFDYPVQQDVMTGYWHCCRAVTPET